MTSSLPEATSRAIGDDRTRMTSSHTGRQPLPPARVATMVVLATSVALFGRGGGSPDFSIGGPTTVPTPASVVAPSAIKTSAPTATYADSSPVSLVCTMLNAERATCGFRNLGRSTALDATAADANNYFIDRAAESRAAATSFGHIKVAGKTGYTGAYPADRAAYRAYRGADANGVYKDDGVAEDNATRYGLPASMLTDDARADARLTSLLTAVHHLGDVMSQRTEVGIAFVRTAAAGGNDLDRLDLVIGRPTRNAAQVSSSVRIHPPTDTTAVSGSFRSNTKNQNPAPDFGTAAIGRPIYIDGPQGQVLEVTTTALVGVHRRRRTGGDSDPRRPERAGVRAVRRPHIECKPGLRVIAGGADQGHDARGDDHWQQRRHLVRGVLRVHARPMKGPPDSSRSSDDLGSITAGVPRHSTGEAT